MAYVLTIYLLARKPEKLTEMFNLTANVESVIGWLIYGAAVNLCLSMWLIRQGPTV